MRAEESPISMARAANMKTGRLPSLSRGGALIGVATAPTSAPETTTASIMNFGSRIHFVAQASEKTETIRGPSPHRHHRNAHYRSALLRNRNSRRLVDWHFQNWNSGAFWRNGGSPPLTSHPAATSRCANVAHSVLHRCFWAARFQRNLRPSQHADHAHRPHHRDRCGNPRLHPAAARLNTYSHWRDRRRIRPEQHIWLGASSSARDRVMAAWHF